MKAFGDYTYHTLAGVRESAAACCLFALNQALNPESNAQNGSGEFALPHLLAPGAWAREPLLPDLVNLKAPLHFIYGERDWMDWRAGEAAVKQARALGVGHADLVRIPVRFFACFF